jgi:soluble lytic murein transglycosylase
MPTVPVAENRVGLAQTTDTKFRAADYGAAGEMIGRSVEQFGQAGQQYAEEKQRQYAVEEHTAGRDADNQAEQQRAEVLYGENGFFNLQGRDAMVALPEVQRRLGEIDRDTAAKIKTRPLALRAFHDITAERSATLLPRLLEHRAKAFESYSDQVDSDALLQSRAGAVNATDRPDEIDRQLATGDDAVERRLRRKGLNDPAILDQAKREERTKTVGAVADQLALTSHVAAEDFVRAHLPNLDPVASTKLLETLHAPAIAERADAKAGDYAVYVGGEAAAETPSTGDKPQPVAPGTFAALSHAVTQQESGGRAGIAGPATRYGNAHGLMQVLDSTGEGIARRIGVEWRPDLMRGKGEAAAAYQKKIGDAYLKEGLTRYNGDIRSALLFYHGGPDQAQWGPKTHAYADSILKRMGMRASASMSASVPEGGGRREIDLQASWDKIDADPTMTFDEKKAVKAAVERRSALLTQSAARDEADARRVVDGHLADLFAHDAKPTSFADFPPTAVARLGQSDRLQYERMFAANRAPQEVKPNGDVALTLTLQSINEPEKFKQSSLLTYRPQMTPAEFESLATTQARMRNEKPGVSPTANLRSEIDTTIRFYARDVGLNIGEKSKPDDRAHYLTVFNIMQGQIERITEGKRAPTDAELKSAFDRATMTVTQRVPGRIYGTREVERRAFEADPTAPVTGIGVPVTVQSRIVSAFKTAYGRMPSQRELDLEYLNHKGQPGYWE